MPVSLRNKTSVDDPIRGSSYDLQVGIDLATGNPQRSHGDSRWWAAYPGFVCERCWHFNSITTLGIVNYKVVCGPAVTFLGVAILLTV